VALTGGGGGEGKRSVAALIGAHSLTGSRLRLIMDPLPSDPIPVLIEILHL
jgi:hypothetical protein